MAGDRHFVFPNSMAPNESGVWAMTRRARRAARFGQPAYRRPLPVGRSLSPNKNPFESIALEPKTYPVAAECPRCGLAQGIDADQIDVVVPDPDDNADPYITWPLSDPFESIGAPDDD